MEISLKKEAIELIKIWRQFGPNSNAIALKELFQGVILNRVNGDKCEIKYDNFDSFEGMMRPNGDRKWQIVINSKISYLPRRNFTLAHEIAHFVGHRFKQTDFNCTFDNINDFHTQSFESEANEFASSLLMAADVVRKYDGSKNFDHISVSELAEEFGVSRSAAAYRWIKLSSRNIGFGISRDGYFLQGRASDELAAKRVRFWSGRELPSESLAAKLSEIGTTISDVVSQGVWHGNLPCLETSYATTMAGFVYTYLDFDKC
jgi:Zn-dependent peptidase ImmA (M78 family)